MPRSQRRTRADRLGAAADGIEPIARSLEVGVARQAAHARLKGQHLVDRRRVVNLAIGRHARNRRRSIGRGCVRAFAPTSQ